jgi:hypothetical protein
MWTISSSQNLLLFVVLLYEFEGFKFVSDMQMVCCVSFCFLLLVLRLVVEVAINMFSGSFWVHPCGWLLCTGQRHFHLALLIFKVRLPDHMAACVTVRLHEHFLLTNFECLNHYL